MKTFKEIAIEESKDNVWHLAYRGRVEGYFVIKAKSKEEAEKYFEDNKDEFFKNSSGIYVDYIELAGKDEEEYVINESDKYIYKTIKTILLDSIEGNRIKDLSMKDIGVKIVFDDKNKSIKVY